MKRSILVLVVIFSAVFQTLAQGNLEDYTFVIVPEEYKFLSKKDQFQLNSMTKFLFNKNGFNAFYQSELPNVKVCDGLVAEIYQESNITRTSLTVILKDCRGTIIFEGDPGRSKYKEYRKAYQDALRKAFENIERLNVRQSDLVIRRENTAASEINAETVVTPKVETPKVGSIPQNTFNQYSLNGVAYLLKKKDENFTLFQESELAENGLLLIGEITKKDGTYKCMIAGKNYPVAFKSNYDLIIYKDDSLMKLKFQN